MLATTENGFSSDAANGDDVKYGSHRAEMHSSKLSRTVDANDLKTSDNAATPPQEIMTEEEKKAAVISCCQGANGFSCGRDETSEVKPEKQKGTGRLMEELEEQLFLTAIAVVGTVAIAVMAYSFYKRSR